MQWGVVNVSTGLSRGFSLGTSGRRLPAGCDTLALVWVCAG